MCSQYGWTVNEWFEHTLREIAILLQRLVKRDKRLKEAERSFHASIHGIKYDVDNSDMDTSGENPSNKDMDEKVEAYLKQQMKDKQEGKR